MLKVTERFNDRMRTNDDEIKKIIEDAKLTKKQKGE